MGDSGYYKDQGKGISEPVRHDGSVGGRQSNRRVASVGPLAIAPRQRSTFESSRFSNSCHRGLGVHAPTDTTESRAVAELYVVGIDFVRSW